MVKLLGGRKILEYFFPTLFILFLSCEEGTSTYIATATLQIAVVGSQMCIYVHKALLNIYASARIEFVYLKSYTNLLISGVNNSTYYALAERKTLNYNRFSKHQLDTFDAIVDDFGIPAELAVYYPDLEVVPSFPYLLAVNYNLENISSMSLTREMLVGIFNKTITNWNDPLLRYGIV